MRAPTVKRCWKNVLLALRKTIDKPFTLVSEAINCHHNYVQKEQHFGEEIYVTRKGAGIRPARSVRDYSGIDGREKLYCSRTR
ncbi:RNA-splicing ligase RtcB [Klebsiella oxytoca]|nr:RNA-splicing ligase RtcB [Klebsiella oxytoca]